MEITQTDFENFSSRHNGPGTTEVEKMLSFLGYGSLEKLIDEAVPRSIRLSKPLDLAAPRSEPDALAEIRSLAAKNRVMKSFIGMGYHDCFVPGVIQRNILENPGWYTQYTPYQAEISQGRLEALLNFQTMVTDLTAMEIANASLLDEGTAAAEAMHLCYNARAANDADEFFVAETCHPQTIAVVAERAEPLGIKVTVGDPGKLSFHSGIFGALVQYPDTTGTVRDYTAFIEKAHAAKVLVTVAADLLALTVLRAPGEMGADVAIGSTQRFGVPLFFGGPHAAYMATRNAHQRRLPGRIVGVSKDRDGRNAYRLALQTREQHIRRDKATSNICTAQVLLAVMSGMYAVYHGPEGLKRIAVRVHGLACRLALGLKKLGFVTNEPFFDTLQVSCPGRAAGFVKTAEAAGMNLRGFGNDAVGIALDETTQEAEIDRLLGVFAGGKASFTAESLKAQARSPIPPSLERKSSYLTHPVFHSHRSETEMLRYIRSLEAKDLSLTSSMIPLGSCTMKLNATSEMFPVSWPEFSKLHPFAPASQTEGYRELFSGLEKMLSEITGFAAVSLQPNSGAQGEYAGLLVIREYHLSRGDTQRNVCLIPRSAHGTNPASAVMAGMKVVAVECDSQGNIDIADLEKKAAAHSASLAALMVTYPSTHGVFESGIQEICDIIHRHGGQVYMDGANLNAQVGVCRPGDYGPDVCHLNLHKTFCIPHGGGGPGMGPIAVASHLAPFLPGHPVVSVGSPSGEAGRGGAGGKSAIGPVSAAPWGSAGILPIPWMYIRMMGTSGLTRATQIAILNANYIASRLAPYYPILFKGNHGLVAHECILDLRELKKRSDVEVEDVAKRLMDYGFHAPTISWPVPGTMMVEPTESESLPELDRFCDAMIAIHAEIEEIASGKADRVDNVLKNAPHTAQEIAGEWKHPYSREKAVFPASSTRERKFWPPVSRIDNVWGDRNVFCTCPPVDE